MIGGLKGIGYLISTVSVVLLGIVSWDATRDKPSCASCSSPAWPLR